MEPDMISELLSRLRSAQGPNLFPSNGAPDFQMLLEMGYLEIAASDVETKCDLWRITLAGYEQLDKPFVSPTQWIGPGKFTLDLYDDLIAAFNNRAFLPSDVINGISKLNGTVSATVINYLGKCVFNGCTRLLNDPRGQNKKLFQFTQLAIKDYYSRHSQIT